MRPCTVRLRDGEHQGWFHRWGTRLRDGGVVTVAIVELENGRVQACWPDVVTFNSPGPRLFARDVSEAVPAKVHTLVLEREEANDAGN